MLAAEFEPAERQGRRRSARAPVSFDARIGSDGYGRTLCRIVDLSMHGVRLQTYSALKRGATIRLTLPEIGPRAAAVVWADDFSAGCQFEPPLEPEAFDRLIALDGSLSRD